MKKPIEYLQEAVEIARDPEQVLEVINEFSEKTEEHMNEGVIDDVERVKHVIIAEPKEPITVIGDIHGDIETLKKILGDEAVEEAFEKGYVVFLGDYVDRGDAQLEAILTPMLMYIDEPGKVIMLRGNHEPPPGLEPYPHDFPYHLKLRFRSLDAGERLYMAFVNDVFEKLPAAAIIKNHLFLAHGGPPTTFLEAKDYREALGLLEKGVSISQVIEELLWNDPCEECPPGVDYEPNPRGAGRLWGPRVTEKTLQLTGTKLIVRGHEPSPDGFKFNHDGKVLTIFSRLGPPYFNLQAAYLVLRFEEGWFQRDKLLEMIKVVTED